MGFSSSRVAISVDVMLDWVMVGGENGELGSWKEEKDERRSTIDLNPRRAVSL
jgi:hypothetical protein